VPAPGWPALRSPPSHSTELPTAAQRNQSSMSPPGRLQSSTNSVPAAMIMPTKNIPTQDAGRFAQRLHRLAQVTHVKVDPEDLRCKEREDEAGALLLRSPITA